MIEVRIDNPKLPALWDAITGTPGAQMLGMCVKDAVVHTSDTWDYAEIGVPNEFQRAYFLAEYERLLTLHAR